MSQLTPRRAGLLGEGAEAVVTAQEGERAKTCTGNVLCTNELCACVVCVLGNARSLVVVPYHVVVAAVQETVAGQLHQLLNAVAVTSSPSRQQA